MHTRRAGWKSPAPSGADEATKPASRRATSPERRRGVAGRTGGALLVLAILAQVQPLAAADYRMKVRPREPVPPPVVEYVPPPPAPLACGPITHPPYGDAHCYGEYRPWRQEGCWWRHGFYVCPKPRAAFGPVFGHH